MELTIGLRLGNEIARKFIYCLLTIGVTTHVNPVTGQDDPRTILAQVRPLRKPKPLPQKPKAKPPQKSAFDVEEVRDPEEDGPAKPAPVMEFESVKLADGSELQIEKWGETFEAYDYRPPVDLDDPRVEEIVWYKNIGSGGPDGMQVDPKGRKLYWSEARGTHPSGRIMSCALDGKNVTALVTGLGRPRNIILDVEHGHLYWLEGIQKHSLKVAELDGKGVRTVVDGLNSPFGLTIDHSRGELYYWEEPGRVVRVKTDGSGEHQVISGDQDQLFRHPMRGMFWDHKDQRLLTFGGGSTIRSLGREAKEAKDLFHPHLGTGYSHFAIDLSRHQIALLNTSYRQLLRVNLDGSDHEVIVIGPRKSPGIEYKTVGASVAFDEPRNEVFFSGVHVFGVEPYSAIFRMKLPPRFKRHTRPAPPLISNVVPARASAAEFVSISGSHFQETKAVTFVDDFNGQNITADFELQENGSLKVRVPKMAEECLHPILIVETASGVTMTLDTRLKVIGEAGEYIHNRLKSDKVAQLWAKPKAEIAGAESVVAYVQREAYCNAGPHGQTLLFLKNDSLCAHLAVRNCVVYHEPFARWGNLAEIDPSWNIHPVPAIRPSFIEAPFTYSH